MTMKGKPMIVGLAGFPGSGKSTAIGYLRDVGFPVLDNGKVLAALFGDGYHDLTLTDKIATVAIDGSMLPHIAPAIATVLSDSEKPMPLFLDSFKTSADPLVLANIFQNVVVETLALICPFSERKVRVRRRARLRDIATVAQRDAELVALGLDKLLENARYRIRTDCSPYEMKLRLVRLAERIEIDLTCRGATDVLITT